MALTHERYEAEGWGVGELWLDGDRVVEHELPAAKRPVRESGPVEGVWGNREVHPATKRAPANNPQVASRVPGTLEEGRGFVTEHPLAGRLQAYFAGEAVAFHNVEVTLDDATSFRSALAEALRRVPRGEVVTYGELAALAGRPGAARAAGTFCARNRVPIFVPCHRVVASSGLGAYGSLGLAYKRRLLELEGVNVAAL